jgi:hypothetical protein
MDDSMAERSGQLRVASMVAMSVVEMDDSMAEMLVVEMVV